MEDLDMSGVDPLRWAEIRRRVAVIKEFLTIRKPCDQDRQCYAHRLDLRTSQFMALVSAWREYGRASAIAGGGKEKGKQRKAGPRHLPTGIKEAAKTVLANLDRSTTLDKAHAIVTDVLSAQGLKAPSRSTVWHLMRASRQEPVQATDKNIILATRCWLRLPTLMDDGIDYPSIILAVRLNSAAVLAASMATDPHSSKRLAAALASLAPEDHIKVENPLAPAFDNLPKEVSTILSFNARRELARAIGSGFGYLRMIYHPARTADAVDTLGKRDTPLSLEDAQRAALAAINLHNSARNAPACSWIK